MGLLSSSVQGDVLMSAFRGGCLVQVFDNDGVPRAHVEAIRFDAFAKEEGKALPPSGNGMIFMAKIKIITQPFFVKRTCIFRHISGP